MVAVCSLVAPVLIAIMAVVSTGQSIVMGKSHVNGIENFWSFAKRRLAKFNGCNSASFVLHLKECEWRYNHRNDNLLTLIKKLYRKTYLD